MIKKNTYNTNIYQFRELFSRLIEVNHLEMLHGLDGFENVGNTPGNDNNSEWHKLFYKRMRSSYFMICFNRFMREELRPQFDEKIVYQKFPTLRIQIPNGKGVAAYHVDSEYNHPIEEINIWLPITEARDSATIQIESEQGNGDYKPQNLAYGQYIMFEGGKLSHGNEVNKTGKTRVSIDMRVIPFSQFKPSNKKGLHYGKERNLTGPEAYYGIIE